MTRQPAGTWKPRADLVALVIVAGIAALTNGCAKKVYEARSLPAELVAPKVENVQELNLAGLGGFASSSEAIDRGDVLEVTILTDYTGLPPLTVPVRVASDGTAHIPMLGRVRLAGLEMVEAEQAITAAAIEKGIYRNPHVTVTMKEQRTNQVTVVGAVEEPGTYKLPRGSSYLLAAIVAAGGLSEEAGPEVEIRRSDQVSGGVDPRAPRPPQVADAAGTQLTSYHEPAAGSAPWVRVNLVSAAKERNGGYYLNDGDVVMINPRSRRPIQVLGLVNKPGSYELPPNEDIHILDALAMAGDRTMELADDVLIIRQIPGQDEPVRIRVSIREAKANGEANVRLAEGDIVTVEHTPVTFAWDALRSFFRFSVGSSVVLF